MAKDDEVLDDAQDGPKGDGFVTGVVVITTLVLIVAFILVEMALKEHGIGLFKGQ
jgi:hypothetical protein